MEHTSSRPPLPELAASPRRSNNAVPTAAARAAVARSEAVIAAVSEAVDAAVYTVHAPVSAAVPPRFSRLRPR
jgi:hypothetical protein